MFGFFKSKWNNETLKSVINKYIHMIKNRLLKNMKIRLALVNIIYSMDQRKFQILENYIPGKLYSQ